jgi:hypothetical protein
MQLQGAWATGRPLSATVGSVQCMVRVVPCLLNVLNIAVVFSAGMYVLVLEIDDAAMRQQGQEYAARVVGTCPPLESARALKLSLLKHFLSRCPSAVIGRRCIAAVLLGYSTDAQRMLNGCSTVERESG